MTDEWKSKIIDSRYWYMPGNDIWQLMPNLRWWYIMTDDRLLQMTDNDRWKTLINER